MLMKYLCAERNAKHAKQYIDDENRIVTIGLFRDINRMIEHEFPEVQFFDLDGRVLKNVVFTLCFVEFGSHVNISIRHLRSRINVFLSETHFRDIIVF